MLAREGGKCSRWCPMADNFDSEHERERKSRNRRRKILCDCRICYGELSQCFSVVFTHHIKLCFVVLKAWVEKQYKLSNLVSLSAGLGQRRSINKQNGGLGYLVFGCSLTSFVLRKLGLFEFIFLNN